jgi:hypothetical protein
VAQIAKMTTAAVELSIAQMEFRLKAMVEDSPLMAGVVTGFYARWREVRGTVPSIEELRRETSAALQGMLQLSPSMVRMLLETATTQVAGEPAAAPPAAAAAVATAAPVAPMAAQGPAQLQLQGADLALKMGDAK